MAKEAKTFEPGDLVRLTTAFLKSTGQYKSRRLDGVVLGIGLSELTGRPDPTWNQLVVLWNDVTLPRQVNSRNLEHVKSTRTRSDLLAAARQASGIPVGKPHHGYQILGHEGIRWPVKDVVEDPLEAMRKASEIFDAEGIDIAVTDPDGNVVAVYDREYSAAYQRGRGMNPPGRSPADMTVEQTARKLLKMHDHGEGLRYLMGEYPRYVPFDCGATYVSMGLFEYVQGGCRPTPKAKEVLLKMDELGAAGGRRRNPESNSRQATLVRRIAGS